MAPMVAMVVDVINNRFDGKELGQHIGLWPMEQKEGGGMYLDLNGGPKVK